MATLGLNLPTEEQWEYACRAGTDTPWHTGSEPRTLEGFANVGDRSAFGRRGYGLPHEAWRKTVTPCTPPSARIGPFGVDDVHGNILEACKDVARRVHIGYADSVDGSPDDPELQRSARGGAFPLPAQESRSARRWVVSRREAGQIVGVRPARVVGAMTPSIMRVLLRCSGSQPWRPCEGRDQGGIIPAPLPSRAARFPHHFSHRRMTMTRFTSALASSTVLFLLGTLPAQAMSGTYQVSPSSNFKTIGAAAAALATRGVSGAVEIIIANGTYNESFRIKPIAGASATNTVTFRAQVPTLNALKPKLNSVSGDLITIEGGVHYVTLNGLRFERTSNAAAINMLYDRTNRRNSTHITVKNCVFNNGVVPSSSRGAIMTQTVKFWDLLDNEFHLKGTALYSQGSWDMAIANNTFDNQNTQYCLSLWNSNRYRCLIYNNVFTGSVSRECVRIDLSHYGTDIFHNTFNIQIPSASGWLIDNSGCCSVWNRYFNNIFVVTGLGNGIRHRSGKDIELNNNIYFIKSGIVGNYANTNHRTLASWGAALGGFAKNGNRDGNSIVGDPKFAAGSSWQLSPSSPAVGKALPKPATWRVGFEVMTDSRGWIRGSKKDIGAFEVAGCRTYGEGCAGTGGRVPALSCSGNLAPGDTVNLDLTNAKPGSLVYIALGAPRTTINLGGKCNLLTNVILLFTGRSNATGIYTLSAKIPGAAVVNGSTAFAQMGVVDNAAAGIGVAFSNGIELRL